jgi:hypothetical protein
MKWHQSARSLQKSCIILQFLFLMARAIANLRVGNNDNRYLKQKYRWARGQETVMAKIAVLLLDSFEVCSRSNTIYFGCF